MRILIISPSFPPAADGEAEHALQVALRLTARGHTVSLLTQERRALARPAGVGVLPPLPAWRWRELPRFAKLLHRLRPEGVVLIYTARLFGEHPMITYLPTMLRWLCPSARLVTVVEIERAPYIRGLATRLGRLLLSFLAGRGGVHYGYGTLLRDTHAVAALGPSILAGLVRQDPSVAPRGLVIPPPPLITRPVGAGETMRAAARARLGIASGDFVLAYFGFVYPGKGIETLLAAVSLLRGQGRAIRLLMSGGGRGEALGAGQGAHAEYEAEMMKRCSELHIDREVMWLPGYPSGTEGAALDLLCADVAVLPFDDGAELRRSSIAVVAGMGLPIVTTSPLGPEPAFVHEDTVLLCQPRDPQALSAAVCRVQDEPGLHGRLAAGAQELAERWFSWNVAIGAVEDSLRPARHG